MELCKFKKKKMVGSYEMARMVGSFSSIDEPESEKIIKISEQSNI